MTAKPTRRAARAGRGSERRAELADLVRTYQRDVDRFDQAVADRLGVRRTDLRCLDILTEAAAGGRWITPTELAAAAGMSPSSVTSVLDRLERAGYARRVRDEGNRRQVQVVLTGRFGDLAKEIFTPVAAAGQAHIASYTAAEVEVLIQFFTRAHEMQAEHMANLQQGDMP